MNNHSIPACYFPSTALFLDDNRDFLLNFVLQLDEHVAYRIFDNPGRALEYIQQKSGKLETLNTKESSNVYSIQQEAYNPNRFTEVSVVVVDYAMPGMNGLEFSRQIDNPNIKKILLTGQADEKLAIEAFNEGLIQRYIRKSESNASELITKSIYELQMQYFQSLSDGILRKVSAAEPYCLQDKAFVEFFKALLQEHGIVEYYLADESGSFLLLDDDANASFLLVKSEAELQVLAAMASSQGADMKMLAPLTQGDKIPALWQAKNNGFNWEESVKHLIPATRLSGVQPYFYALLSGNQRFDIRQQKILSYHRYLVDLDAEELLMG